MNRFIYIFQLGFLFSCVQQPELDLQIHGALKEIMHKGARQGVVQLSEVINDDHVYGIGAMENLDGEILIMDSQLLINRAKPYGIPTGQTIPDKNSKALLLVTAKVNDWQTIQINQETDYYSIDSKIKAEAKKVGVDIENPFPFIITGEFSEIDWHIISPQSPDGSHDDHLAKSWKRKDSNTQGKILGFYSEKHQAVFTHHTRYTHMHILYESDALSGHIDGLKLNADWQISFPK